MASFDQYLPEYRWRAAYSIRIPAPPERVFAAVESADFSRSWVVRVMFFLRGLPRKTLTVDGFLAAGQCVLVREPGRELLLGFVGRPWQTKNVWKPGSAEEWQAFAEPDYVRIAWGFRIEGEKLITETRVQPTDAGARRKFGRYWLWVAPFSGLVRKAMLREIKRECRREQNAEA